MRGLFRGSEKLWALERAFVFMIGTTFALFLLGRASTLVPRGGAWDSWIPSVVVLLATLVASLFMMRWVEERRRPLAVLGLPLERDALSGLLRGAAIGGLAVAGLVAVQLLMGWLRPAPDSGTVFGWIQQIGALAVLLAFAAAAEEVVFRGYAFQVLVQGFGAPIAVVLGAGVFAAFHARNPEVGPTALLNIGLAGVLLAGAYLRTRSLWVAIGLHWAWNWVMAAVFDLPVSGWAFDVPGYDFRQSGPDAWTGGAFGPEGGMLATLTLVLLSVWVFRARWLRESAGMAALRPLIDAGPSSAIGTSIDSED